RTFEKLTKFDFIADGGCHFRRTEGDAVAGLGDVWKAQRDFALAGEQDVRFVQLLASSSAGQVAEEEFDLAAALDFVESKLPGSSGAQGERAAGLEWTKVERFL